MKTMKTMNIILAGIACALVFGIIFAGFGSKAEAEAPKADAALGGWAMVTDNTARMMSEPDATRITNAIKANGGDFEPLGLVATQVVSGTNYMYLVYGTETEGAVPGYYFMTVYEDTKGNDTVIGATAIDVTNIQTAAPLGKGATGAWAVRGSGKPGMLPDQDAQVSFDAINKGDVIYNPVALLATQVVSGTNYKALCVGNDKNLYVVTWYKDLKGGASLTSAECVNIGAYSGM